MKKVKKIFSFLLAMTMTLAMGISAAADTTATTGSISIKNAAKGETYTLYKIFDATYSGSNVSYTIDKNDTGFSVAQSADCFVVTKVGTSDTYVVQKADSKTDSDVLTWASKNYSSFEQVESQQATGTTLTFENLEPGYYAIKRTNKDVVTVVTVKGSEITANDKNGEPGWEKPDPSDNDQVNGKNVSSDNVTFGVTNDAKIGDTVYFKVGANVPKYHDGKIVTQYEFTDKLDDTLKLDQKSIKVKLSDDTALTLDTDYTTSDVTDTGFKLQLKTSSVNYPADGKIIIEYEAEVLSTAAYENNNTISMTWKEADPDPTDPTKPTPDVDPTDPDPDDTPDDSTTHTYVYGFNLEKVDQDGNTLNGAEFKLYDAETDGNEIKVVKDSQGVYRVSTDATAVGAAIEAGTAKIFGLKAGTQYYLEETKAPDGYNKLTSRVEVTIIKTDIGDDGYMNTNFTVENKAGAELPSTGGIGTTIFYVIGSMLMIGAAVLLVTRKKMSVSND